VRAIDFNRNEHIFAGTYGSGIFRSTNNGDTWVETPFGLTHRFIFALAIHQRGDIFVGTNGGGVFRSLDNGGNWRDLNSGLTNLQVRTLAINASGYIFAGTIGAGVFRSVQPIITRISEFTEAWPSGFFLEQNYPNPFNPLTTIPFSLPRSVHVTLKVFNHLGEEVKTLMNQKLPSGRHEARWIATEQASGVYFYRLQAEGFVETKKLILVK
jgi:ligand-binding sensor domain-containing protein